MIKTPWYMRLLGYKKYRRKEWTTYYILGVFPDRHEEWVYYNNKEI